jgi:hypothetical protein
MEVIKVISKLTYSSLVVGLSLFVLALLITGLLSVADSAKQAQAKQQVKKDYVVLSQFDDGAYVVLYPKIKTVCLRSYGANGQSSFYCWGVENAPAGIKKLLQR